MKKYYPMATYDGETDNFHTLTTYDCQDNVDQCLSVIRNWISAGFKIDNCWIQEFEADANVPKNISVHILADRKEDLEKELRLRFFYKNIQILNILNQDKFLEH